MLGLCWAEGDAPPGHNDATRTCFACDDTEHYSTTLISTRASSVIAKHVTAIDGPLFLYLPFQETHGPAEVPTYWRDKVDATTVPNPVRRDLLGKLMALDSAFANISNALRYHAQNGDMLTNTVWVYTTDNGGPIVPSTGVHDDAIGASNWPLRGGKHNAYEGGVRGAAWIWDGRGLDRGGLHAVGTNNEAARDDAVALGFLTYDGVIHAVDWLPTICALAGCTVPAPLPASQRKRYGLDIDGIDHSTALRTNDTTAGRTVVVLDVEAPKHPTGEAGVVRMGEWKLHLGTDAPSSSRPGDWSSHTPWMNVTLNENTTHQSWGTSPQLYNVVTDPSERHDVINDTAHTALVAKLRAFYHQEKDIAVYPFSLGPAGHPNKDGVWEPWLGEERGLRELLESDIPNHTVGILARYVVRKKEREHRAYTTVQRCIGMGKQRSTTSLFLLPTRSTKVGVSHSFGSWRAKRRTSEEKWTLLHTEEDLIPR